MMFEVIICSTLTCVLALGYSISILTLSHWVFHVLLDFNDNFAWL